MPKLSTGAAIKAVIETAAIGYYPGNPGGAPVTVPGTPTKTLKAFRRRGPMPTEAEPDPYPYVVIHEAIAVTKDHTNHHARGARKGVFEEVQVDLYQRWRDPETQEVLEDRTLADRLLSVISAAQLPDTPQRTYGMALGLMRELPDPDPSLIRHMTTARVARSLP